ncbi:MAG: acetyl-CoA carboxylase biotin carboxyl carrier protein [Geminicoccaceae bacterium]|jgi:acetyl-CoA carboxylase biotin carboxyl carrier protein|nr:acetyl-CoA carboxylase biotin carboxyl carrier protein [Geminicoccaceae bacterium]HRY22919.1 acetyl-CoA carboxylase biotin carboxyl carrier protein [Geminicoccaceae bacterium]
MGKLNIDTDYVAALAELLQRTGLTEIEISEGDARVRVVKKPAPVYEAHVAPRAAAPVLADSEPTTAPANEPAHPGTVTSPMVGTVYLYPEPGADPFVAPGQTVREGETLLIIEAMKVMNQIRAPRSGRIARIFVDNATPVEFGEPLLIIE